MRRRMSGGALAPLGVLVLTSCTAGGGGAVPSGWQEERVDALRLAVPPGWVRDEDPPEVWSDRWELVEDGTPVARLAVEFDLLSNGPKAGLVMQTLLQTLPGDLDGFEVTESDPDPVDPDADFARVRYTYRGPDGASYDGVLWSLGEGREQPATVQLTGSDLDDDLVQKIGDGLAFDPQE